MPKSVLKSIQTCFEHVLRQTFRKIFAQFSMEGQVFETVQKNQKICKIPKMPKIVPKSIQTCFELVLGQIFRKVFLPSVPWRVESSKIFKKYIFKFPKMPKSVPKSIQTCFRVIFSKKFYAQCSMEGGVFENFPKNQKILKIQKCPKSFPKVSKHVLNMFWGKLFEKFLPSFPWNVESSKIFKKIYLQISKMPKSVPKSIQTCFRVIFSKKFYAQCSMEGGVFENFQKNQKIFKIPKMPKIVPKSMQTCFEHVLGQTFRKIFAQFSMECRVFENFQKKFFQNSKNAQKFSQMYPNVF